MSMREMAAGSVQCCITSPPYFGLRDYGHEGQIGLEATPDAYVARLVEVFREVRRVLRDDGTLWLNLGDSYAANRTYQVPSTKGGPKHSESQAVGGRGSEVPFGLKPKDLIGIPWRAAFALQADGWYLRQDIIWAKPNPMPESVTDRCTKSHEYLFLLSKNERYYFDHEAIKEPTAGALPGNKSHKYVAAPDQVGDEKHRTKEELVAYAERQRIAGSAGSTRNKRSVWTVATRPYKGAHFATFPTTLVEPCVLAGSRPGDTVLDPFGGSGTTGEVACRAGRRAVLCELNPEYATLAERRIATSIFGANAL